MNVVTYARVSRAEHKDRDSTSITVQQADCRERAEAMGWTVVGEYKDDGASAWKRGLRRDGFERMLARVAEGGVEAIVVREMDRLLRQMRDGARITELYEAGDDFHLIACTLQGDIDLKRATDRKDMRDRNSLGEFYSDFLGEKIRPSLRLKAARGEWAGGGRRPFGYRVVADTERPERRRDGLPYSRLVVDGSEAELIRSAARHVLSGGSIHSVVQLWNDGRAPKDAGGRWTPTDVRRVLMSEQVAGLRGDVRGTWDAILTADEHLALTAMLRDPARRQPQAVAARRWALAGVVRCASCGSRMQGKASTRSLRAGGETVRRQYVCSTGSGGCATVAITAPDLERHVIALVLEQPEPEWEEAKPIAKSDAATVKQLRDLEERKRELGVAFADELMTPAQVAAATEVLDRKVGELQRSLSASPAPRRARSYIHREDEFMPFMDGKTSEPAADDVGPLNELVRWAVSEVRVSPARSRGVRFDPSRVEVALVEAQ